MWNKRNSGSTDPFRHKLFFWITYVTMYTYITPGNENICAVCDYSDISLQACARGCHDFILGAILIQSGAGLTKAKVIINRPRFIIYQHCYTHTFFDSIGQSTDFSISSSLITFDFCWGFMSGAVVLTLVARLSGTAGVRPCSHCSLVVYSLYVETCTAFVFMCWWPHRNG